MDGCCGCWPQKRRGLKVVLLFLGMSLSVLAGVGQDRTGGRKGEMKMACFGGRVSGVWVLEARRMPDRGGRLRNPVCGRDEGVGEGPAHQARPRPPGTSGIQCACPVPGLSHRPLAWGVCHAFWEQSVAVRVLRCGAFLGV